MSITLLALAIFLVGYILITLEHKWDLHKAATAAALGAALWLLIGVYEQGDIEGPLSEIGGEIFALIMFLIAAMTLVEMLVHYRLFDLIQARLLKFGFTSLKQFWVLSTLTFFLSAIIDNLTTTIVMTQVARRFFQGRNLLYTTASIVIAANAGGAFSPIGDVTTLMLWLAHKFTSFQIIRAAFLPSAGLLVVSTWLLSRGLEPDRHHEQAEEGIAMSYSEKIVVGATLASFALPLLFSQIGLQPYLGLLLGLGGVAILITLFRLFYQQETHLTADMEKILPKVDFASILFFAGILLAIGALRHLGILHQVSERLFGEDPGLLRLVIGNTSLGVLSSIVDNIPLTAAAIDILRTTDPAVWALLAVAVGTGGSLLVIGSAAGVVAMGMVKELTFFCYLRIATMPALAGYITAIALWYAQYRLLG
jgi:Na+/H+ antiporter NhaD/arsenite permease-like protein